MAMAQELPTTGDFSLDLQWPAKPEKGGNLLLDASIGRLQMLVAGTSITSYQDDSGTKADHITVPLYHLVNWLAHNWWAFLYEPRKFEREEAEKDFRTRHWLGTAREGFALPDVTFSPAGGNMEVISRPTYLRFAQLNFLQSVTAIVPTESVRTHLHALVDEVLGKLLKQGIEKSEAHRAWARVIATAKEEEAYCRLVGSLGLSPYVDHPDIDKGLEVVGSRISESMLVDLCEAANIGSFQRAADATSILSTEIEKSQPLRVEQLLKTGKPADGSRPAYEWGYSAGDVARRAFGIANDDPIGSATFFEKIGFNKEPEAVAKIAQETMSSTPIMGAVKRDDGEMKLSLAYGDGPSKKFAAARASFLAWSPSASDSRLVTTARTRDQRASRAFAAEILAPANYLKKAWASAAMYRPLNLIR
jgi:hypothetical protein